MDSVELPLAGNEGVLDGGARAAVVADVEEHNGYKEQQEVEA